MKAIVFTEYGSPDRLQVKEVAKPTPKDDEVLVQVHASSINSWDWEFQSGTSFINRLLFGLFKPKPVKQVLGAEPAAVAVALGGLPLLRPGQPGDEMLEGTERTDPTAEEAPEQCGKS